MTDSLLEEYYRVTGGKIKFTEYIKVISAMLTYGVERDSSLAFINRTLVGDKEYLFEYGLIKGPTNKLHFSILRMLEYNKLNKDYFKKRLVVGDTLDEAIFHTCQYKYVIEKSCSEVEVSPGIYKSLDILCEEYNINKTTVKERMKIKGNSLEQALTEPVRKKTTLNPDGEYSIVLSNGLKFKNVKEACDHFGKDRKTVLRRIQKGCPVEKALTISKYVGVDDTLDRPYRDSCGERRKFIKLSDALIAHEVPEEVFKKRMKDGWELTDAVELPLSSKVLLGESFWLDGVRFNNLTEACRKLEKDFDSVVELLRNKYNVRSALKNARIESDKAQVIDTATIMAKDLPNLEKRVSREKSKFSIMCEQAGAPVAAVKNRMKKGMTFDQAVQAYKNCPVVKFRKVDK